MTDKKLIKNVQLHISPEFAGRIEAARAMLLTPRWNSDPAPARMTEFTVIALELLCAHIEGGVHIETAMALPEGAKQVMEWDWS